MLFRSVHPEDAKLAKRLGIKPKKQVLGIPNGIDFDAFHKVLLSREEARKALHIAEDKIIFGTIANFFPPKNLPNYIEACALVAQKLPQAQFLILGEGMERKRIEGERKRYGLENSVLLPGNKNQASRYLQAFDIFVLPSSKEGMSFALLEAMTAGLPCVATDVGAASFMFENEQCGWIASPDKMEEIGRAHV